MSESDLRPRTTRALEIDIRLALLLAGLAAAAVLLLFFILDPAQDPEPTVPIAYEEEPEPVEAPPVDAQLVSNVTAVRQGEPFRVGVMLRLQPGWFVFWQDPGDAGLPTTVDIRAPEGFTVDELRWPTPTEFLQPGQLTGYGYGDQVLLTATVRPPDDLGSTRQVPVRAHVSWLTCERVCVSGEADLETNIPIGEDGKPDNLDLFATWARRLPISAPDDATVTVATSSAPVDDGMRYTVVLDWSFPPLAVQWFPIQDAGFRLVDSMTRVTRSRSQTDFVLQVAGAADDLPTVLEAVVACTDPTGVRRGLEIEIPLEGLAASASR